MERQTAGDKKTFFFFANKAISATVNVVPQLKRGKSCVASAPPTLYSPALPQRCYFRTAHEKGKTRPKE